MPVQRCINGKYRIGNGECIYSTKDDAEKAYRAYLAKKYAEEIDGSKNEQSDAGKSN